MKQILAIDPGASGGFAWNDITGTRIKCLPMPETEGDIIALIRDRKTYTTTVLMEQVVGFIPGGGFGSGFTFGTNFGFLKGVVQALGLQLELVRPPKWQKALSLGAKKDYDKKWKHHLKERAQQIYPRCDGITLKTADALLILYYGLSL